MTFLFVSAVRDVSEIRRHRRSGMIVVIQTNDPRSHPDLPGTTGGFSIRCVCERVRNVDWKQAHSVHVFCSATRCWYCLVQISSAGSIKMFEKCLPSHQRAAAILTCDRQWSTPYWPEGDFHPLINCRLLHLDQNCSARQAITVLQLDVILAVGSQLCSQSVHTESLSDTRWGWQIRAVAPAERANLGHGFTATAPNITRGDQGPIQGGGGVGTQPPGVGGHIWWFSSVDKADAGAESTAQCQPFPERLRAWIQVQKWRIFPNKVADEFHSFFSPQWEEDCYHCIAKHCSVSECVMSAWCCYNNRGQVNFVKNKTQPPPLMSTSAPWQPAQTVGQHPWIYLCRFRCLKSLLQIHFWVSTRFCAPKVWNEIFVSTAAIAVRSGVPPMENLLVCHKAIKIFSNQCWRIGHIAFKLVTLQASRRKWIQLFQLYQATRGVDPRVFRVPWLMESKRSPGVCPTLNLDRHYVSNQWRQNQVHPLVLDTWST